jgi:hypothetical protein
MYFSKINPDTKKGIFSVLFSAFWVGFIFNLIVVFSTSAQSASLFLSPSSGSYDVGKTFTVAVSLNGGGSPGVNAADGYLSFSTSYLSVIGLSTSNSIFSLWPIEPSFSNSKGEISFAGGSPTAYTGGSGTILVITFKGLKAGSTKVTFSSGSALAADGKGSNILSSLGEGNYTFKTGAEIPEVPETPSGKLPALPMVSSPTHPDQNSWYSNNDPEFTWPRPEDVMAVSLLVHENPLSVPDYVSEGMIESTKYNDVEDGTWYFHIKFKNLSGWGSIAHRKFLVDTQGPDSFEIKVQRTDPTDPQPVLIFEATDKTSGIGHYEVKINDNDWIQVSLADLEKEPYKMPIQSPGKKNIEVKAVDKAGNSTSAFTEITVEPLKAPTITEMPERINRGEILVVKGISFYSGGKIEVFLQRQDSQDIIKGETLTDEDGSWAYFCKEELEKGVYEVWAKAIDNRGAQSNPSAKKSLIVVPTSIIQTYGWLIILVLVIIVIILIMVIFYQRKKCEEKIKKIRKETEDVKRATTQIFKALREEVEEQVEFLDKKPMLSESEEKVRDKLKEALDISEEFIGKEIKDIEDQVAQNNNKKKNNNK